MNQSTTISKMSGASIDSTSMLAYLFALDSLTTSPLNTKIKDSRRRHSHNNRAGCDKV